MKFAVLIPCYNEEITIAKVIADFKISLPNALIYVCDNNSTDKTVAYAQESGAIIFHEKKRALRQIKQILKLYYSIYTLTTDSLISHILPASVYLV
jgi:glycosyltransferase involved in cell wall biosynthesis